MNAHMHRAAVVVALAVLVACGADRTTSAKSSAVLSDGRNDGAAGFYLLPPVAPEPGSEAVNDAGLSPVVEIVALGAGGSVLARFEGDDVKASDAHYMVLWSTKQYVPVAGTTYRIRVLLDGKELGFADAQVAKDGKALRLLAADEIFGLTGQRTLPIKFRIHEEDADLCANVTCPAPAQCQVSVACDPATGACLVAAQPQGFTCEDGNACTTGDACDGEGGCVGGAPVVCANLDECNPANRCDPAAGCVYDHLVGTSCTQTSGPWAGTPGICQLNTTTGLSYCADFGPSKPSP